MTVDNDKLLDDIGWQLLRDLQENARLPFAELGRRVGLSLPAVAERVRRMEEAGIIMGYRAEVCAEKIGWQYHVIIRLTTTASAYPQVLALVESLPEILECHHVTGSDAFVLKVVVSSIPHLEDLIAKLSSNGQTHTSIVLSSPMTRRPLDKPSK